MRKSLKVKEKVKCKITKATIKNQITIDDYKNAIYEAKNKYVTNFTIDSKKHHLETKEH